MGSSCEPQLALEPQASGKRNCPYDNARKP